MLADVLTLLHCSLRSLYAACSRERNACSMQQGEKCMQHAAGSKMHMHIPVATYWTAHADCRCVTASTGKGPMAVSHKVMLACCIDPNETTPMKENTHTAMWSAPIAVALNDKVWKKSYDSKQSGTHTCSMPLCCMISGPARAVGSSRYWL